MSESSRPAVAAIDSAVERGTDAVRLPDAVVRNRLGRDVAGLAARESAGHIARPSARRQL